jgi:hypothetical protein
MVGQRLLQCCVEIQIEYSAITITVRNYGDCALNSVRRQRSWTTFEPGQLSARSPKFHGNSNGVSFME